MTKPTADADGVIIERVVVGRYARVTAIDPATGVEATVVADAHAPVMVAHTLAVRKLQKLLKSEK